MAGEQQQQRDMYVFTHSPCNDGTAAARAFQKIHPTANIIKTAAGCADVSAAEYHNVDIVFLDLCCTLETAGQLAANGCTVSIIDHHQGNVKTFNAIADMLPLHAKNIMVMKPFGCGSAVSLVVDVYDIQTTPLWRLVSEFDTFQFCLFTKNEAMVIYWVMKQEGDSAWERLEKIETDEDLRAEAARNKDAWEHAIKTAIDKIHVSNMTWSVNGGRYQTYVCEVLDHTLTAPLVDMLAARQEPHVDYVLLYRPNIANQQDVYTWSIRRLNQHAPDCHVLAQCMVFNNIRGNGHAGAAGFTTGRKMFFLQ